MILSFWQLRRSKRITSLQADLYYFLLQESSSRGHGLEWENPFECSNKLICAGIGISEDAIGDARNRLKQLGLIEFIPGERNKKPAVYEIFYPFKTGNITGNSAGKDPGKTPANTPVKDPALLKEERNVTVTEQNKTSVAKATGAADADAGNGEPFKVRAPKTGPDQRKKSSAQKKKVSPEDVTPHWAALVDAWFSFHEEKKLERPSFKGRDPAELKGIADNLQKRAKDKGETDWTKELATQKFTNFLQFAYKRDWVKKNFLLSILNGRFDAIINDNNSSNGTQQRTSIGGTSNGAGVIPANRDYTKAKL